MSEPRRLHPIAVLTNIFQVIKGIIFPILIFLFSDIDLELGGLGYWLAAAGVAMVILLSFLGWLRYTYRIEDGEVKIESGLFIKTKSFIPLSRIQSMDVSEGILQRLFGLVKIRIETAGGSQADAVLSAVRKQEAKGITEAYAESKRKGASDREPEDGEETLRERGPVFEQGFPRLLIMAVTSGGVGVIFSGAAALISQVDDFIPFERYSDQFMSLFERGALLISIVTFVMLLFAYVLATAVIMLKYAFFTVRKAEEELVITRGLLEKRSLTIPLRKIQGIRIAENLVRQPIGYASVYVEYAGGSLKDKESTNVMLFPLIKKAELKELLQRFLPEYDVQEEFQQVPGSAYSSYLLRFLPVAVLLAAVCLWFLRPWGYVSLALIPAAFLWAYLVYRESGWNFQREQLQLRRRVLSVQTLVIQKNRIQSFKVKQSFMQKRRKLSTVQAVIKSGPGPRAGNAVHIKEEHAAKIWEWFSR
ncbi:PH domain-containing protein [Bacillus massiliglaciei]|uniref:PH domain-containing protein n=1 Tax=Bacillus massiliglaciei TaxID=1816693 RepID=UPI000AE37C3B|nr:PH domain-containing protein [Bacillus massiliglaciei]